MNEFLRWFVPVYFAAYAFVSFIWRGVVFYRRTGKNPIILGDTNTPHGYVGFCFKIVIALVAVDVVLFAVCPETFNQVPFDIWPLPEVLKYLGVVLLLVSLGIIGIAQVQMGNSWRVGINTKEKTALILSGLYRYSRNPIYVGMMLTILGLFFILPNALSLLILVLGYVLLHLIVRLEEGHLAHLQGESYVQYCRKVRRWI